MCSLSWSWWWFQVIKLYTLNVYSLHQLHCNKAVVKKNVNIPVLQSPMSGFPAMRSSSPGPFPHHPLTLSASFIFPPCPPSHASTTNFFPHLMLNNVPRPSALCELLTLAQTLTLTVHLMVVQSPSSRAKVDSEALLSPSSPELQQVTHLFSAQVS